MDISAITLKKLHTEGRLSIGDTLHHSRLGRRLQTTGL